MKRTRHFFEIVVSLVFIGALALGAIVAFRAVSGGGPAGSAAKTPQGYPPPQATVATVIIPTRPPEPPTPTFPPVPTPLPTPVVTVVPTSELPIIPLPTEKAAKPYTVVFQGGGVLRAITNNDSDTPALFDIPIQSPLSLIAANSHTNVRPWAWGSLSPDGSQLALVLADSEAPTNIYLLNLANRNLRRLAQFGVEPAWSPDGAKIAYRDTQTRGLWIVDIVTGSTKEIFSVETEDEWINFITWSPNSERIAFVKTVGMLEVGELWVVDAKGEGKAAQLLPSEIEAGNLNWSPIGNQIAFVSTFGEHLTPTWPSNIWVVDAETGERWQLTQNISTTGGTPDWSPDGKWIVFEGANLLEGEAPPYDLWLVTGDGSELKRLTSDPASDLFPAWTSDPNKIVFQKKGAGIWELNLATNVSRQLHPQDVEYVAVK